jgi:E3 ubiquitin-protein ligase HUWE1
MSRVSGKVKDAVDARAESPNSLGSEEEDMAEDTREETPDLYRTSALGM